MYMVRKMKQNTLSFIYITSQVKSDHLQDLQLQTSDVVPMSLDDRTWISKEESSTP